MNSIDIDDGPDEDLTRSELPKPEIRQMRGNAHLDRRAIREMWYKPVPALAEARKKRSRFVPENEFQYTKLEKGEIRLLCLRPYKTPELASSPLFARVFTRRLADVGGCYEALSYTWGDQSAKATHEIHLRNLSHRLDVDESKQRKFSADVFAAAALRIKFYRFPIYKNLYEALMRLRGMVRPVIIWVDAICIDQSDDGEEEKRQQLQMMDQIYHSAASVCVWLGPGFRGSTDGMRLAQDITNFQTFDKLMTSMAAEKRWPGLIKLLKSPWFNRRWIIQEIALAREATLHCGDDRIHWDDFAEAVSLLMDRIARLRKGLRDEILDDVETTSGPVLVATLNNVSSKPDKGDGPLAKMCDLETLVCTLLGFQATYPKDVIYSVISLARDPPQPGEPWEQELHSRQLIRLENSAAAKGITGPTGPSSSMLFKYKLSTRDVFIAFVTRSIFNSGHLDIVCRHWAPPVLDRYGEEVAMPSWVSPLVQSPFGLAGTFKVRQNSDNLVAYSAEDRRRRYSSAGSSKAEIIMANDQPDLILALHPLVVNTDVVVVTDNAVVRSPLAFTSLERPSSSPLAPISESQVAEPSTSSSRNGASIAVGLGESAAPATTNGIAVHGRRASEASRASALPAQPAPSGFGGLEPPPPPPPPPPARAPHAQLLRTLDADNQPAKFARLNSGRTRRGSLLQRQATQTSDLERTHYLSGVMQARGFVVGRIHDQSDVMRGGIVPGEWVRRLGWAEDDSNHVAELLWRTLVADRTPRGGYPPAWYKRACLHALVDQRKTDAEGNLHSATPVDREISEHITMYLQRVESVVWNRRLIHVNVSDSANLGVQGPLFGVGPGGSERGDLVCVLLGCSVPVVLGKATRKGLYRVVGEAYVHGIMEGETMRLGVPETHGFLLE